MRRKILLAILMSFMIIFSILQISSSSYQGDKPVVIDGRRNSHVLSDYTPHDPIVISSDADFAGQGWPGNGNQTNPYTIDGFSFYNDDIGISISHTTSHFVISNCYFASDNSSSGEGISLIDISHGNISMCNISTLNKGIYASTCSDLIIEKNSVNDIRIRSFDLRYCSNLVVTENQVFLDSIYTSHCTSSNFTDNRLASVSLSDADSCRVTNNLFIDCKGQSLSVGGSHNILVENNTFENEYYPATFGMSSNITLRGNVFEKVGIEIGASISEWASYIVEDNNVDSLPIVTMLNRTDETIDLTSVGQLILVNSDRCVVQNGVFNGRGIAISLWYCEDTSIEKIGGEDIANSLIELYQCSGCSISEVYLETSMNTGVYLRDSSDCSVEASYFDSCSEAIFLSHCFEINVLSNTLSNSATGISSYYVNGSLFYNNSIQGNSYGMRLNDIWECVINDNDLSVNSLGITGWNIIDSTFTNNIVFNNRDVGFYIKGGSENNIFYNNTFYSNWNENAIDDGFNNTWDNGINIGNYWDDYNGTGVYEITGTAGSIDRYPKVYTSSSSTTEDTGNFLTPEMIIILLSAVGVTVIVVVIIIRKR